MKKNSTDALVFDFDGTLHPSKTLNELLKKSIAGSPNENDQLEKLKNYKKGFPIEKWNQEVSLDRRLSIVSPTPKDVAKFVEEIKGSIESIISKLLLDLKQEGYPLFVVSLGFSDWISPALEGLIPIENIFARKIIDRDKNMSSTNTDQHSKKHWVREIKKENESLTSITMIGDGPVDFNLYEDPNIDEFIGVAFYHEDEYVKENCLEKNLPLFQKIEEFDKFMRNRFLLTQE